MAVKELGNLAVSIFCRNMSMLISAGIDAEESVGLLADDAAANDFRDAAKAVQNRMLTGQPQLSGPFLLCLRCVLTGPRPRHGFRRPWPW